MTVRKQKLRMSLATHPSLSTPSSRNPITLRLRKILSTTFTTTEALQTLSHLYSIPSTSLSHVERTQQDANDDDDLDSEGIAPRDGGSGHADVPNETTVCKNLQRDLENKLAEGSQHFLKGRSSISARSSLSIRPHTYNPFFPDI